MTTIIIHPIDDIINNSINDSINNIDINQIQCNDTEIFCCNICSEQVNKTELVRLKCNPSKHYFCYSCILDWYKEVKKLKYTNHYIMNMCPICRKNGGFLPIIESVTPIKGIHQLTENSVKKNAATINMPKCGIKLKTKDGFCQVIGKPVYGGLCGIHCKTKN